MLTLIENTPGRGFESLQLHDDLSYLGLTGIDRIWKVGRVEQALTGNKNKSRIVKMFSSYTAKAA